MPRGQFTPRPGASIRQLQAGASFANSGAIAVNVTTNRLYITATNGPSASGVLEVLDGATNQIIDQVTVPSSPIKVAVDSQRNRVYVLGVNSSSGGNAYSVYVLDGGTNTFTRTVPLSGGVNNRPALVTDEGDNLVFLLTQTGIDMLDGNSFVVQTVMNTITASSILPTNLAIDPYQRLLAVAGVDTSENKLALATYSLPNAGQPQPLVPLKRVNLYATTAQDIGPLMVDTDDQRLVVGYATPCDRISCYRVHAIRESLDTGGYGSLNVSAPDQAALMPAYDRTLDHVYLRLNDTVLKVIDLTALIRGNFNAWFVATAPFTQDAISDMQANPITNIVYATDAVTQEIITYQDSGPACWPGPPVTISPTADHQGGLSVVVASVGSANFLQNIQFGVASNGLLDGLGLSGSTGNTRVTFQPGTTQVQFTVRRAAAGMWTTVPFTVGYTCGTWPTFVGGGPDAF